jgi:hypothetical protein
MYDDRFDTDWERLDSEECIERAFALGVTSVVDAPRVEEYERLLALAENAYGRGLIEMSYREGRARAQELRSDGLDTEAVWNAAVDEAAEVPSAGDTTPREREGPPAALDSPGLFERPDDDPSRRFSIPDFLQRRR